MLRYNKSSLQSVFSWEGKNGAQKGSAMGRIGRLELFAAAVFKYYIYTYRTSGKIFF